MPETNVQCKPIALQHSIVHRSLQILCDFTFTLISTVSSPASTQHTFAQNRPPPIAPSAPFLSPEATETTSSALAACPRIASYLVFLSPSSFLFLHSAQLNMSGPPPSAIGTATNSIEGAVVTKRLHPQEKYLGVYEGDDISIGDEGNIRVTGKWREA